MIPWKRVTPCSAGTGCLASRQPQKAAGSLLAWCRCRHRWGRCAPLVSAPPHTEGQQLLAGLQPLKACARSECRQWCWTGRRGAPPAVDAGRPGVPRRRSMRCRSASRTARGCPPGKSRPVLFPAACGATPRCRRGTHRLSVRAPLVTPTTCLVMGATCTARLRAAASRRCWGCQSLRPMEQAGVTDDGCTCGMCLSKGPPPPPPAALHDADRHARLLIRALMDARPLSLRP